MMQTENCRSESKVVLEMSALLLVAIAFFLDRGPPLAQVFIGDFYRGWCGRGVRTPAGPGAPMPP
jgi:hypothetical protein